MAPTPVPFRELLSAAMLDRDLTQVAIARAAELEPSTVARFVAGDRVPTALTLHKIADALGWDAVQRARALAAVAAFATAAK